MYVGSFGAQSWARLSSAYGRIQVGLQFMCTVASADPASYRAYREEYALLFFQSITASRISTEHKYLEALLSLPGVNTDPLFRGAPSVFSAPDPPSHPPVHSPSPPPVDASGDFTIGAHAVMPEAEPEAVEPITRSLFLARRQRLLLLVLRNLRSMLEDTRTEVSAKAFVFRSLNELVSTSKLYKGRIVGVIAREEYGLWMRELRDKLEWVADRVPSVLTLTD